MPADTTDTDAIALSSSEALPAEALKLVTSRDRTTFVLLAGSVGSGKTTIVVSLYELLNDGPVGGFLFGGSETLAGFEQICHTGREVSGRSVAETVRTNPSSEAAFLHLRLADMTTGSPSLSSVLISDVTGEAFDQARDFADPTIVPRPLWRRADMICLILDGQRLSSPTKRHVVRTEARSLLGSARASKLISAWCRLAIVTTKWDLVTSVETEAFVKDTEALLLDQYGSDFAAVSSHRIAARPSSQAVPYAYGIPNLLTEWMSRAPEKVTTKVPPFTHQSPLSLFVRAFWERERKALEGTLNVI